MSKPFVVQSDASNKALGAVLLQEHEGSLLPCFYAIARQRDKLRDHRERNSRHSFRTE